MSRALNIKATVQKVTEECAKADVSISTIEPLDSGGTRLVCKNGEGAAVIRRKMKSMIIDGDVTRSGLYAAKYVRYDS